MASRWQLMHNLNLQPVITSTIYTSYCVHVQATCHSYPNYIIFGSQVIMFTLLWTVVTSFCTHAVYTLYTSLHTVTSYNTTYTIYTCDIHTVHELHTPSQQPVDNVLMQTLLWLHTALAYLVLL